MYVWHYCDLDGRQASFLCPNGTMFNQAFFVCDWWYNLDCQSALTYSSTSGCSSLPGGRRDLPSPHPYRWRSRILSSWRPPPLPPHQSEGTTTGADINIKNQKKIGHRRKISL
ncbi:putative Chitin binding Peritrophin-A domain-containing protein 11 [Homarus americanus]|uniref:Putative Chitin binding Peritrophin-A domain-containing protein 11 n=1 Tax=Homarus americanus TaxID=6706 RepID=A0A8J5JGB9_HOMAM|nr:putative Chitin binding Peritrophin-A domain-containing protein 11 [Homarus americanus]